MICGIDIGLTGSVAIFTEAGQFVEVFDIPTRSASEKAFVKTIISASDLAAELQKRKPVGVIPICYVEDLAATNTGTKIGAASLFSLGASYGRVMTVLELMGWPPVLYRPADWKRYFGLTKKRGEEKDKDASRTLALKLYPEAERFLTRKKDHNRAEAILITRYGMDRSGITKGSKHALQAIAACWGAPCD